MTQPIITEPIQTRGDTAANWTLANPILLSRQEAVETDTLRRKIGDGATPWRSLPYATALPADVAAAQAAAIAATSGQVTDAAVAAQVTSGTTTTAALRAAFVPKWAPNTAYAQGDPVLNPSGQTVTANAAFTSGATYDSSKWTVVSGGAASDPDRPTWATTAHKWDAARSLYNANPRTMRRLKAGAARALAGGNPLHIACEGDSITYGGNLTSPLNVRSYPGQLRATLNRYLPPAGTGIVPCWVGQPNDARLTYGGTWTDYRSSGYATHSAQAAGTGQTITFAKATFNGVTTDLVCDTFKVYYRQSPTEGTFTASVDGGTATNVNATNATEGFGVATIAAGSLGSHSLVITAPASGTATIIAVEGVITGGQVKVTSAGYSGSTISNHASTNSPTDALYCMCDMATPDVQVVLLETNDYGNLGTSIATYTAKWQALITRAQSTGADVLIVATVPPQAPRTAPAGSPTLAQYTTALYGLADSNGCALLDMQDRWTDWATSNALGLYSDDYHPSQSGYDDLGRAVADVILGGIGGRAVLDDSGKLLGSVQSITPVAPVSTRWYGTPCASSAGISRFNGEAHATPIRLESVTKVQAIGVNVTVAGAAGSVARLGIYTDNAGYPGSLVIDAGTVDCSATGGKSITISQSLAAGRYWLVCALQGSPATQATIWGIPASGFIGEGVGATTLTGTGASAWMNNTITGALPATFPGPSSSPTGSPRVMVQVA